LTSYLIIVKLNISIKNDVV